MSASHERGRRDAVRHEPHAQPHPDAVIAALAREQDGRVRRSQLEAVIGHGAIDYRRDTGGLIVVENGVYAVGHDAESERAKWRAATLAGGDHALLSHVPALQVWGLTDAECDVPHVTIRGPRKQREGIVWHWGRITDDERAQVDGLPVTSRLRALRDSAPILGSEAVHGIFDRYSDEWRYEPLTLNDMFALYPRHPGCRIVREVIADRVEAKTRSWLERRLAPVLVGLPKPLRNHRLDLLDGRVIYADCFWMDKRFILEADGRNVHQRRAAFESDRARDASALVSGYVTMRVSWKRLRDEPKKVRDEIRAVLATR